MRSYDNNDDSIDKSAKAAETARLMQGCAKLLAIENAQTNNYQKTFFVYDSKIVHM